MIEDVIWNSVWKFIWTPWVQTILLWGFSVWQERQSGGGGGGGGDVRGALLNTTETRSQKGGRGRTRPLIYLFAPLLFQALEKKAKKSAKGRERLSWVNYQVQREELVGGYDHEMNRRAALERRARGRKEWLLVKRPLILGYKTDKLWLKTSYVPCFSGH